MVSLESIFTSPDVLYLQQEDDANKNPLDFSDKDDGVSRGDSFMYFIRNGKFSVHVKTEHLRPTILDGSAAPRPVTYLIDGDHFGEIGMIFDSKRTATVQSENYGTLAMLKKVHYLELAKTFDSFATLIKKNIFKYQDEQTMWLQIEMEKIDYFAGLSLFTKQELLAKMVRKTYEKDALLIKRGQLADSLILVHQGLVQVSVKYDRRRPDDLFVIERLGRGAVIN